MSDKKPKTPKKGVQQQRFCAFCGDDDQVIGDECRACRQMRGSRD